MAIDLHSKYSKQIQTAYKLESLIHSHLSSNYDFTGVKTVNVVTPITVPMTDYTRSGTSRYGEVYEMQDVVQEMMLTQDKAFSMTIDKGNYSDQSGVKEAGRMLSLQISEQAIPLMDTYCFNKLSHEAGKIVSGDALTNKTICSRITAGTTFMDNAEVPTDDRVLYLNPETYAMLRTSEEFMKCDSLLNKSLTKGQVGTYDGMKVIKVPNARWPQGVNFMIVHKSAACAPVKLNDTKLHRDPPGISGNLLEGRQYYDLFVFGAKANGVYVDLDSAKARIASAVEISDAGVLSTEGDAQIKYTTDGSDPRYSKTAKVGTQADVTAEGTLIRAYAFKDGAYRGDVCEKKL